MVQATMVLKSIFIEKLLSRNYYLARVFSHLWWSTKSHGKQPLVIYQMGKVGSMSILYALRSSNLDMPIYHVHALSDQGIIQMEQMYWGETFKVFRKSLLPETQHVFASHFLRAQLNKRSTHEKWKVVTLVREPIARNVSEFFFSIDTTKHDPHLPDFYEMYESNAINTSKLIDRFVERFHENSEDSQLPLKWFDNEFKTVLGIDVFSSDFPKSKGYQIIREELTDVLLLKLEKIQECYSDAFNEFLELSELRLRRANTARQRKYYPAFKSFMDLVDLPASYVSTMYNSKYMRHFYDDEEINILWNKWHKQ